MLKRILSAFLAGLLAVAPLGAFAQTATAPISQLPAAVTPYTGSELFPVVQNGITRKANLGALRPLLGGSVNLKDYGAVGDGTTDNTAAYNAWIAACKIAVSKQCYAPAGQYNFKNQPNCINGQVTMFGDNLGATVFFKDYSNPGSPQGLICFADFSGNDTTVRDIGVYGKAGRTGGSLISIIGNVGPPLGFLRFVGMNLSTLGACTQDYIIYIDGTPNSIAPIGVRDVDLQGVTVFGAAIESMHVSGVVGLSMSGGGGIFPAGCGNASSGSVHLTGSVAVPANNVFITVPTIQGGLVFDNTTSATLFSNGIGAISGVSVTNTATANSVIVMAASYSGTIQSNWVSSQAINLSAAFPSLGSPNTWTALQTFNAGDIAIRGTAHGLVLSEDASAAVTSAAGTSGNPFISGGAGADGAYGTLNLASANAVGTSILGPANGGTGVNNAGLLTLPSSVQINAGVAGQVAVWAGGVQSGSYTPTLGVAASQLGTLTLASASASGQVALSPQGQNKFDVATTVASAAGTTLDDVKVSAETTTISGNTHITTAAGVNKVTIGIPTYSAASALTVDQAASLYIDGPPAGGGAGPATITNAWSLHTGAGHVYLQSGNGTAGITDGFSVARNCGLCEQRIITNLTGTGDAFDIDLQYNNTVASQSTDAMLTSFVVPSGNSTNHGTLTVWNASGTTKGSGTTTTMQGLSIAAGNQGTGTVTTAIGANITMFDSGNGTNTATDTIRVNTPSGTASGTSVWTDITGIKINDQKPSGAGTNTLTNAPAAILINSQTASGAFAIKQSGSGINQFDSAMVILNATAVPAGGTAGAGYKFSTTSNLGIFFGSGAPTLSAAQGSIYIRTDGSSTSTRLYINTNGSTAWTNVTSAT